MSQQLHQAVTKILAMPYFKNEQARSGGANYGHEAAVEVFIKEAGFNPVYKTKTKFNKITKKILKNWITTGNDTELRDIAKDMVEGEYIAQPGGSQGSPDFLILDHGNRFIGIECKSGKDGLCPMWNDSVPGHNVIYVLSSGKMDRTTIFLGPDVISDVEKQLMKLQEEEIAEVVKKWNLESLAIGTRGFVQKSRKQHFQQGGEIKTNYFTHTDRIKCETNALGYAQQ